MSPQKFAATALVLALSASAANAQKMYWSDFGGIVRANLDGSQIETVASELFPFGIAIDVSGRKIYWTDRGANKIQRANLDGSGVEDLVTTGLDDPRGIALDLPARKMYWANRLARKIQRSNLDGSGVEDLVSTSLGPSSIALDPGVGKVYWTMPSAGGGRIQRANLDGSDVEDVIPSPAVSVALDLSAGKIYWTLADIVFGEGPGLIQRANLDGSNVEDLVATGRFTVPWGIALDVKAGKMYWTETTPGRIRRADLNGSGVEDLVTEFTEPREIALDLLRIQVPTLPAWGMPVMGTLLLGTGILIFRRRCRKGGKPGLQPGGTEM